MRVLGLAGATALCGLLSTTALYAQVTAAEVWQQWKDFSASAGQTMTVGSEAQTGDTLVVSGLTMTSTDADVTVTGTLDEIRFRDVGDGTVEITMSPTYPVTIDTKGESGEPVNVVLAISQTGLKMIAGGSADVTKYDFTAASMGVATTSVTEAGAPLPVEISFTTNSPTGSYQMARKEGDVVDLTSSFTAGQSVVSVKAKDDVQQSDLVLDASISQIAATSSGTFGASLMVPNLADALKAGFATDVALTYGALTYTMNVTDANGPTTIRGKSDGGTFGLAMDKARIALAGGGKGVEAIVTSAQIPFPEVAVRYAESVYDFLMPVSAGPEPQNFVMTTKLIGLTVSEEIWALIDPGATLPRDPATLILETNGTAKLTTDIMNEEAMAALGEAPPGELHSLNIPALQLTIAGAELKADGALTFDNTDLTTFQGMPAPTGTINISLVGANALLDKLVALGLVPEDQVMGARMMMGMFARPGEGPDSLVSTLEFKDKGFFANGMQLQ